jgi:hypothetical protein
LLDLPSVFISVNASSCRANPIKTLLKTQEAAIASSMGKVKLYIKERILKF